MKFNTDGLIIYESPLGEKDRIVTVLTRTHGVIRGFVRNATNIKSSKSAATRLLCYSDISVYESKDKYIIDSAESKEMFIPLRNDVVKMSLAQYFCQLCFELCPTEVTADEFLQLMLNSLFILCRGDKPCDLVKSVFELRLLSLAGYMPDLLCCSDCGKFEDKNMYFIPHKSTIMCGECNKKEGYKSIKTGLGITAAMRHAIYAEPKKIFSFNLSSESLKRLSNITEEYLKEKIGKSLPTLEFYKVMSSSD